HRGNCAVSCKACRRRSMNTQVCPCSDQRQSSLSTNQSEPPNPPTSSGGGGGRSTGSAETRSGPSAHQNPSSVSGASKGQRSAGNQEATDRLLSTRATHEWVLQGAPGGRSLQSMYTN